MEKILRKIFILRKKLHEESSLKMLLSGDAPFKGVLYEDAHAWRYPFLLLPNISTPAGDRPNVISSDFEVLLELVTTSGIQPSNRLRIEILARTSVSTKRRYEVIKKRKFSFYANSQDLHSSALFIIPNLVESASPVMPVWPL